MPGILLIDDESQIRKLLEVTLRSNGYKIMHAENANDGLTAAAAYSPDIIILDLGLPDEDGQSLLLKLREWFTKPIIILSVQHSETAIIRALDNGANDYMVKPFRTGELLARIRSALRNATIEESNPVLECADIKIDLASRTIKKNNELLKLTATQYSLLALFGKNEGKVLTHQYILREVWGESYIDQLQYLRVFVAQLRKKIEKDANYPEYIVTESGVGYRFIAKENV